MQPSSSSVLNAPGATAQGEAHAAAAAAHSSPATRTGMSTAEGFPQTPGASPAASPAGARLWRRQSLREADFAAMLRNARLLRGEAAALLMRPNAFAYARLGLIVPKRAVPLATRRNRLKRIVREWFRRNQGELGGRDWIVRVGYANQAGSKAARKAGAAKAKAVPAAPRRPQAPLRAPFATLDQAIVHELARSAVRHAGGKPGSARK